MNNADVKIPGYNLFRLDRYYKRGGGVCAYVRETLKVTVLREVSHTSDEGFQQLWLRLQHEKLKSFLLGVVYRPPDCGITCLDNDLTPSIVEALLYDKDIFIIGDLNCDLHSEKSESKALNDFCTMFNLSQIISKPTRVTRDSSSLLDVILTTNPHQVIQTTILENSISDHFTISALLRLKAPKPHRSRILTRTYKNYDSEKFSEDISKVIWNALDEISDLNSRLEHFNTEFLRVLDLHAPVKHMSFKHRTSPFIPPKIKEQMKIRDKNLRKARKTRCDLDWALFRKSKTETVKMINEAEKLFVGNEIEQNKDNSRAIWKTIRRYLPNKSGGKLNPMSNAKGKANEFNSYFASVGSSTAEAVMKLAHDQSIPVIEFEPVKDMPETEQFSLSQITQEELITTVRSMPSNKSPGIDKVSINVLKDCLAVVSKPLTDLINLSFTSNTFPTAWKIAEVVPHVKERDPQIANNNRPISLLVANSKICEKIVCNQLTSYLERHSRLSSHQSGNRRKHSTESLNLIVTDYIFDAIDEKKVTVLVQLDLSKAFDSIDHGLLLHKLRLCGISSHTLEWFRSYLSGRTQAVRIGTETSDFIPVTKGVPQGSILGPLLFNIFINDLPSIPLNSKLESYVDDSKLILSFRVGNLEDVLLAINKDLSTIATYLCTNSLLANPDKTKIMFFGSAQMLKYIPPDTSFTFLGKTIQDAQCKTLKILV